MEIKFRGKRIDTEQWVVGNYLYDPVHCEHLIAIYEDDGNCVAYEVYPESVGQYINIQDIDNEEIFKGDIVEKHGYNTTDGEWTKRFEVVFDCGGFCLKGKGGLYGFGRFKNEKSTALYKEKIIGNSFDNPELL